LHAHIAFNWLLGEICRWSWREWRSWYDSNLRVNCSNVERSEEIWRGRSVLHERVGLSTRRAQAGLYWTWMLSSQLIIEGMCIVQWAATWMASTLEVKSHISEGYSRRFNSFLHVD